jgi:hypothetical protein
MTLTITDDSISGDHTNHTARLAPGHQGAWEASWLPGQLLDRNSAITAMVLAEAVATRAPQAGDRLWPHIEGWADELGLTAPEALARIAEPSGSATAARESAGTAEPEAAG